MKKSGSIQNAIEKKIEKKKIKMEMNSEDGHFVSFLFFSLEIDFLDAAGRSITVAEVGFIAAQRSKVVDRRRRTGSVAVSEGGVAPHGTAVSVATAETAVRIAAAGPEGIASGDGHSAVGVHAAGAHVVRRGARRTYIASLNSIHQYY